VKLNGISKMNYVSSLYVLANIKEKKMSFVDFNDVFNVLLKHLMYG
jgi:hypothetical protein